MSRFESASQSVVVTTGTPAFPLRNNPASTTTAGSSDFINSRISSIDAIIIEKGDSAFGALVISDHAGTSATAITVQIASSTTSGPTSPFCFPAKGIAVDYKGLQVTLAGTALRVRVAFTAD